MVKYFKVKIHYFSTDHSTNLFYKYLSKYCLADKKRFFLKKSQQQQLRQELYCYIHTEVVQFVCQIGLTCYNNVLKHIIYGHST